LLSKSHPTCTGDEALATCAGDEEVATCTGDEALATCAGDEALATFGGDKIRCDFIFLGGGVVGIVISPGKIN
jgi:hypothetical protein